MSEQTKKRTRNKLACTNSDFENELVIAVPGEGGWDEVEGAGRKKGENRQGVWGRRANSAIFTVDNQQVLLNSTGNSGQCYAAAWVGQAFCGESIRVHVWLESLCRPPETITTLLIGHTPR